MGSLLRSFFTRHRSAIGVAALVILTAPLGVSRRPLWVGDETREAAIAKQMADSGDFFQTRLAGLLRAEKPPFYYASVASSIRLRHGATRVSTRLPSILFSAMTLLSAAAAAAILFSQRAGFFTAAILSTTYLFVVNAHNVVVDVSLTAFVTMGLLAFVASSRRCGFPRWDLGFGLAAAGAILAKGFVGPALLLLLTLPFWFFERERRRLSESFSAGAWLAPAAALLLWTGVTYGRGGMPALSEAIWNQQVGRLLGFRRREYSHHRAPFYFYLAAFPGMLFPWIVTLPAAIRGGLRQQGRGRPGGSVFLALATGLAAALLFLSFAETKRTIYFLPIVPLAAILVGSFLDTRLSETDSRVSWSLWIQFVVVALAAVAVPLLPATADGKITPGEAACVGAVALACAGLAFAARRSPARLVTISLLVAMGSLFLLDRYSLPRWQRDRATRDFFARVERRMAGRGSLYSYGLNEDVLGRACLELSRPPLAQDDPAAVERVLRQPGAFLLTETSTLRDAPASWAAALEPVELGRAGNRPVALLRLRGRRRQGLPTKAGTLPRPAVMLSTPEAKALADSVRKEKPPHQNRQNHRTDDGGDFCSGCLPDPERVLGNDVTSYENAFCQEVQDQRDGHAEEDPLPLAGKSDRVVNAAAEVEAQPGPDQTVDERGGEVGQDEGSDAHPGGARGEEDDRPQTVEVTGQEEKPIAMPVEGRLDLPNLRGREDLLHEPVPVQAVSKESPKPVQDRIRNHDSEKLRPDHQGKPRYLLENQEARDEQDDFFGRTRPEGPEEEEEEDSEVALPLQVLRHPLDRRLVHMGIQQEIERREHPRILTVAPRGVGDVAAPPACGSAGCGLGRPPRHPLRAALPRREARLSAQAVAARPAPRDFNYGSQGDSSRRDWGQQPVARAYFARSAVSWVCLSMARARIEAYSGVFRTFASSGSRSIVG